MQATDLDLSLVTEEDIRQEVRCESAMHEEHPPHAADWYWRMSCGFVIAVCDTRRYEASTYPLVLCILGCGVQHWVMDTEFIPMDHA